MGRQSAQERSEQSVPGAKDPSEVSPGSRRGDEAPEGTPGTGEALCRTCGGSGQLAGSEPCPDCGGTGRVTAGIGGG